VWIAEAQSRGRGRQGRAWSCAPHAGLLVSWLLRDPFAARCRRRCAAGARIWGLAKACERATGLDVRTKWPNDLWLEKRKLAGLLVERAPGADAIAIAGLRHERVRACGLDSELPQATTLAAAGCTMRREDLLARDLGRRRGAARRLPAGRCDAQCSTLGASSIALKDARAGAAHRRSVRGARRRGHGGRVVCGSRPVRGAARARGGRGALAMKAPPLVADCVGIDIGNSKALAVLYTGGERDAGAGVRSFAGREPAWMRAAWRAVLERRDDVPIRVASVVPAAGARAGRQRRGRRGARLHVVRGTIRWPFEIAVRNPHDGRHRPFGERRRHARARSGARRRGRRRHRDHDRRAARRRFEGGLILPGFD
jgi:biotin-(acetyl-CoA carboxylase) ligase